MIAGRDNHYVDQEDNRFPGFYLRLSPCSLPIAFRSEVQFHLKPYIGGVPFVLPRASIDLPSTLSHLFPEKGDPRFDRVVLLWLSHSRDEADWRREIISGRATLRILWWPLLLDRTTTEVFLAHPHAIDGGPGIIGSFRPLRLEYVMEGGEPETFLRTLLERGILPIRRHPFMTRESFLSHIN